MRQKALTVEEIARRGRDFYERELRPNVEAAHHGQFLVLDVITHSFEIADDDLTASDRVLKNNPKAVLYGCRIGYAAAYRIGPATAVGASRGAGR